MRMMTTSRFFRVDLEPPAWAYAWMARGPMFRRIYRRLAADLAAAPPDFPRLLVADALALPFAAGVFHQALATFSLHNWPEPAAGVREIMRVLRPGGRAFIYE